MYSSTENKRWELVMGPPGENDSSRYVFVVEDLCYRYVIVVGDKYSHLHLSIPLFIYYFDQLITTVHLFILYC